VRQVGNGLYEPFEFFTAQFVDHQGENNGRRKAEQDPQAADHQGVSEYFPKVVVFDDFEEVFETDPWTAEDACPEAVILECDDDPCHGRIAKQQIVHGDRDEKDIERYRHLEPRPSLEGRGVFHQSHRRHILCAQLRLQ
jgi:hypothetical protein